MAKLTKKKTTPKKAPARAKKTTAAKRRTPAKKKQEEPAFAVGAGQQLSVDKFRLTLDAKKFHAGLRRDERLILFAAIMEEVPLAWGSVQILTKMANTRMIPQSGDPRTDSRMVEIWDTVNGFAATNQLLIQSLGFGFSVAEYSWDDTTLQMTDVKVSRSQEIRKAPDRYGNVQAYLQYATWWAARTTDKSGRVEIPAHKVIDCIFQQTDAWNYYGTSLFRSAVKELESLTDILGASISVFNRVGKPRFQVTVDNTGVSPEEYTRRLALVKSVFSSLADGTDFYSPPGTDVKIIGSESFGVPFQQESTLVVSHILSCLGVPPALLHLQGQTGSTESFTRQTVLALQQILTSLQTMVVNAWNRSFWKVVQQLEGMPVTPKMSLAPPRLLEELLEQRARAMRFNNDKREVVMGLRPAAWLSQRVGIVGEPDDPKALQEQIEKAREEGDQDLDDRSGDADNQTKGTDERASSNNSM